MCLAPMDVDCLKTFHWVFSLTRIGTAGVWRINIFQNKSIYPYITWDYEYLNQKKYKKVVLFLKKLIWETSMAWSSSFLRSWADIWAPWIVPAPPPAGNPVMRRLPRGVLKKKNNAWKQKWYEMMIFWDPKTSPFLFVSSLLSCFLPRCFW